MFEDMKKCCIFVLQFIKKEQKNIKKNACMRDCIGKITETITEKRLESMLNEGEINVFSSKFKKKSYFSLNSGNLCLTLQLEMRPIVWSGLKF